MVNSVFSEADPERARPHGQAHRVSSLDRRDHAAVLLRRFCSEEPLTPRQYRVNFWAGSVRPKYDWIPEAYTFGVESGSLAKGGYSDDGGYPVVIRSEWLDVQVDGQ